MSEFEMRSLRSFWRDALTLHGSILPHIVPQILCFGAFATLVFLITWYCEEALQLRVDLALDPFEIAGVVLSLMLVLRTNAGHERWWEARKLWGGIVNQSRNLAIAGVAYGPADAGWRQRFVAWTASFPHVARCRLREEKPGPAVAALLGAEAAATLSATEHAPTYAGLQLAALLREALERFSMDRAAFLQAEQQRALLLDHVGGCERILNTPMPKAYAVVTRRLVVLFLLNLPFALLHKVENDWMVPLLTMVIAYPMLSLDQIGLELQNPFAHFCISPLPLDELTTMIARQVAAVGTAEPAPANPLLTGRREPV